MDKAVFTPDLLCTDVCLSNSNTVFTGLYHTAPLRTKINLFFYSRVFFLCYRYPPAGGEKLLYAHLPDGLLYKADCQGPSQKGCFTRAGTIAVLNVNTFLRVYYQSWWLIPEFCTDYRSEAPKPLCLKGSWNNFDPEA